MFFVYGYRSIVQASDIQRLSTCVCGKHSATTTWQQCLWSVGNCCCIPHCTWRWYPRIDSKIYLQIYKMLLLLHCSVVGTKYSNQDIIFIPDKIWNILSRGDEIFHPGGQKRGGTKYSVTGPQERKADAWTGPREVGPVIHQAVSEGRVGFLWVYFWHIQQGWKFANPVFHLLLSPAWNKVGSTQWGA